MTMMQILLLGASAYFAFKIYEHIQTLQDPIGEDKKEATKKVYEQKSVKSVEAFSPFSAEELIEKADNAFENKDYKKALAFLQEADAKDENNPETLYKIGYIFQEQKDYDRAITYYKKALEFDKKNEYIHNSLASIYRNNKEYVSAQMHIRHSLAINDKNPVTYFNYANLLVDMDSKDEAIEMYKKALELDPDLTQAKEEIDKLNEAK